MRLSTFCLFVSSVVLVIVRGQQDNDQQDNDQSGSVDGRSVLEMGLKYNNPLLRLIGEAMKNSKQDTLEKLCSLDRCGEWTPWSACSADKRGQFGMTTRTRQCGNGPVFCKPDPSRKVRNVTESKVCIWENCPTGFTKTNNNFCLFAAVEKKRRKEEANELCNEKGAFVVNVNSETKRTDVFSFIKSTSGAGSNFWVDGQRKDVNSPWEFMYQKDIKYTNWGDNDPDNGPSDLYIIMSSDGLLYDTSVSNSFYTVCEYV